MYVPVPSQAVFATLSTTAATLSPTLASKPTGQNVWVLTVSIASWVAQGASPTAAPSANANIYLPAGASLMVDSNFGANVSVVGTAAGVCTFAPCVRI